MNKTNNPQDSRPRLGLCCLFRSAPIRFRTTTAKHCGTLAESEATQHIAGLVTHNAQALLDAIRFCARYQIGAFRINSGILPLATHPDFKYQLRDLPQGDRLTESFKDAKKLAMDNQIRLSFHPDQFVVLNSPSTDVVRRSVEELEHQAALAELVGADVVNLHAGGVYGDRHGALQRLRTTVESLSETARSRLTLENDDRSYTPTDLLPVCHDLGLPLVYDVHHHRCIEREERSVAEITEAALATWNREPLFHVSSPKDGWGSPQPRQHADFIAVPDFPEEWRSLSITVDVEAKAKELAVIKLQEDLALQSAPVSA